MCVCVVCECVGCECVGRGRGALKKTRPLPAEAAAPAQGSLSLTLCFARARPSPLSPPPQHPLPHILTPTTCSSSTRRVRRCVAAWRAAGPRAESREEREQKTARLSHMRLPSASFFFGLRHALTSPCHHPLHSHRPPAPSRLLAPTGELHVWRVEGRRVPAWRKGKSRGRRNRGREKKK